jgi:hypothetical protein
LIARTNYQIFVDRERINRYNAQTYHGNHGYDYELKSMEGTFVAFGKPFKNSYYSTKSINLIDVYSLLCRLIQIDPKPNNGSFQNIKHILNDSYLNSFDTLDDYFLQNDLKDLLLYGVIFFFILIVFLSNFKPILTIMRSVGAKCHNPDPSLSNQTNKKKI